MTARLGWYLLPLVVVAAIVACHGSDENDLSPASPTPVATPVVSRANDPIKLVVTIPVFADFARQIGGENVEVVSLVPEETNPHTYEPTAEDAELIRSADVILSNGLGLEGQLLDFIEEQREGVRTLVVDIAGNVPSPSVEQPPDRLIYATEAGDDPHLWLDPQLAKTYPETVADSLTIMDSDNRAYYHANFGAYWERLRALDEEIAGKLEAIPPDRRKLVTYHDSFSHFARRYDLEVVGVATHSPVRGPSPGEITSLARAIQREGVPAVFNEPGFDADPLKEAASDTEVEVCTLYTDALDERIGTYLDMMRFNADELVRCLSE